jgi:hypothetical protein
MHSGRTRRGAARAARDQSRGFDTPRVRISMPPGHTFGQVEVHILVGQSTYLDRSKCRGKHMYSGKHMCSTLGWPAIVSYRL